MAAAAHNVLCTPRTSRTVSARAIPSEAMVSVAPVRSPDGPFRVARDDGTFCG